MFAVFDVERSVISRMRLRIPVFGLGLAALSEATSS